MASTFESGPEIEVIRALLADLPDPAALLAGLFSQAPIAFQVYRADGRSLLVNDAFVALFGSAPPPDYCVFRDEVAARSGLLEPIRRAFAGASVHIPRFWYDPRELEHVRVLEGRRVAIECTFFPLRDASGAVSFVAIAFRDRTAEELAHAQLEAERERLEVLLQGVADGITMVAPDGEIVYANDAAAPLFGAASGAQVRALSATAVSRRFELRDARGAPTPDARMPYRRALAGEVIANELVRFRVLGESRDRWCMLSARPVCDATGRVRYCVNFFRDVTAQHRAEEAQRFTAVASEALASSLDYAATLASVARLAVPELSDGCEVYLRDDSGAARPIAFSHVDATKTTLALDVENALRAERSELTHDDDGSSMMRVAIRAQGRAIGVLALASAGSGRVFDARDLALAEELAHRIGMAVDNARLFELTQRERKRAEEASRAKDDFLSIASHELRTPLNAILGWAHMLRAGGLDADQHARALEVIDRNAKAQARLIEDLLDVSSIMAGTLRYSVSPVSLAPIVEAAVQSVRQTAEAKGITLQLRSTPTEGVVRGDPARLQQVVWNLCSNAIKFTPKGGRVVVEVTSVGEHLEVLVSDTGEGITSTFLPHVFETFRQSDSSSTRAHGGLGLGLSIVKHLVEAHGGEITARSEGRGKGATFTVRLPQATSDTPATG